ncbi:hypothetical protein BC629DRAFT_344125 [Irpex lacteus]|nr:hypothetical protein BC629DRAFT_344125 [Irpex lacteus]
MVAALAPMRAYAVSDITHIILYNLRRDKQSLASCSLVCTNWTFVARLHLFATVHVDGPRANEFHAFLQSPGASSIRDHIRSLQWTEEDKGALDIGSLCKIMALLPRASRLQLSLNRFGTRPTAFPYEYARICLSSVRTLRICCRLRLNGQQNNVQPLAEFLTWFNLEKLDFGAVKDGCGAGDVDPYRVSYLPIPSRPLPVEHLRILNGDAIYQEAEIMARILRPASSLRTLTCQLHCSEDVYALGRLIRYSASNLVKLTLICDPDVGRGALSMVDWHKLYLPCCPNLKTISLPNFWSYTKLLAPLFAILSCDADSLCDLILGVSRPLTIAPNTQWSLIENLLLSLRESVMVCVDLRAVVEHAERGQIKSRIEGQWSALSRRRRMRFEGMQ